MSNNNTPNVETNTQYGILPGGTLLAPRASASQATSAITAFSVTTAGVVGTGFAAFLTEVANTLIALGAWKGSA